MIWHHKTDYGMLYTGVGLVSSGACLGVATFIHNIIRSATYDRPRPAVSLIDPEAWQVAVIPGRHGLEKVALSYKIRY